MEETVEEDADIALTKEALQRAHQVGETLSSSILRDMVIMLNETKLKLLMGIKDLKQKLAQQKEDQADIYYYLNKKCDDSYEVIASLEDQLQNEQADREIAEKIYEKRIADLQHSSHVNETRMLAKNRELEDKLNILKDFMDGKEESQKLIEELKTTLRNEKTQWTEQSNEMERRWIFEREKLKKDFSNKIEKFKAEIDIKVEDKLKSKTIQTQLLNVYLKRELKQQSQEADKVLGINEKILQNYQRTKKELELAQSAETEMTNKLAMYQRIIKQLNEKIKYQEELEEQIREEHYQLVEALRNEIRFSKEKLEDALIRNKEENKQLDELWLYLSEVYSSILAENNFSQDKGQHSIIRHKTQGMTGQDSILLKIVQHVLQKYPSRFEHLWLNPALTAVENSSLLSSPTGVVTDNKNKNGNGSVEISSAVRFQECSLSSSGIQFPMIPTPSHRTTNSSTPTNQQKNKNFMFPPSGSVSGVPSWDLTRSDLGSVESRVDTRSIGTQTEGRILPYPLGSVWLNDPKYHQHEETSLHSSEPSQISFVSKSLDLETQSLSAIRDSPVLGIGIHDGGSIISTKTTTAADSILNSMKNMKKNQRYLIVDNDFRIDPEVVASRHSNSSPVRLSKLPYSSSLTTTSTSPMTSTTSSIHNQGSLSLGSGSSILTNISSSIVSMKNENQENPTRAHPPPPSFQRNVNSTGGRSHGKRLLQPNQQPMKSPSKELLEIASLDLSQLNQPSYHQQTFQLKMNPHPVSSNQSSASSIHDPLSSQSPNSNHSETSFRKKMLNPFSRNDPNIAKDKNKEKEKTNSLESAFPVAISLSKRPQPTTSLSSSSPAPLVLSQLQDETKQHEILFTDRDDFNLHSNK